MFFRFFVLFAALVVVCKASGGLTAPRKPTSEDQAIADQVRDAAALKTGQNFSKFDVVAVRTQVVAGTNYYMKVAVGGDQFIHIRVFKALPVHGAGIQLHAVQSGKSASDALSYF